MKERHSVSGVVALATVLLAGCSSHDSAKIEAPPPSPSLNCADVNLPQSEWMKHCASGNATPGSDLVVVKVGQPLRYQYDYTDGTSSFQLEVNVSKIECGIESIPRAADNPAWDGSDDIPRMIDATPAPGKEFCRAVATMKNIGRTPGRTVQFGNLVIDKGEFKESDGDADITDNVNGDLANAGKELNPGDSAEWVQIWSAPVGARPLAVLFPMTTLMSGPLYRIEQA
ncbi:hypothetical protein QLQ12_09790 [Actinoplanes sp. NEAU-A12]|uniref:DUF4352 domain-containing protein n=1 Tax=Actinoplanes sandaracinus TaxID=3045177 RepID=A0ABT6WGP5_9ACTN|nr:hypothetical protein [Actinoplanes sandaracinus]MDI6098891.1 hypothetical protein [Actinoplanes sandaracinus]